MDYVVVSLFIVATHSIWLAFHCMRLDMHAFGIASMQLGRY